MNKEKTWCFKNIVTKPPSILPESMACCVRTDSIVSVNSGYEE